jgi:hypothetical protein
MLVKRIGAIFVSTLFCFVLLTSCADSPSSITTPSPTSTRTTPITPIASPSLNPTSTGTPDTTPTHYTSQILLSGVGRPDDLASIYRVTCFSAISTMVRSVDLTRMVQ